MSKERIENMINLGFEIKKEENELRDIRYRDWLNLNTKISQALLFIINAENIIGELDDFSLENGQCYPEFEDFYNQIAVLRRDLTKFVDENPELLEVNNNITKTN